MKLPILLIIAVINLAAIKPTQGHGILRIAFHSWVYQGAKNCDSDKSGEEAKCDPMFRIKVSRIGKGNSFFDVTQKDYAPNTNLILFTEKIGGYMSNPLNILITENTGNLVLDIFTYDMDENRVQESINKPIRKILLSQNNSGSAYISEFGLKFSYSFVCDNKATDMLCNNDCHYTDDEKGHYACDAKGIKRCLLGYVFPDKNCVDLHPCAKFPCGPNGQCMPVNETSYYCDCKPGYSGDACTDFSAACAALHCLNGAKCREEASGARCLCRPGYSGARCNTDMPRCSPDLCQNGGTCTELFGGFTCTCKQGYTGVHCESDRNECEHNPCLNGGTCVNREGGYRCDCPNGLTGELCQADINECTTARINCPNGSKCVNTLGGHVCAKVDFNDCANAPCSNGGRCEDKVFHFMCDCTKEFSGPTCGTGSNAAEG